MINGNKWFFSNHAQSFSSNAAHHNPSDQSRTASCRNCINITKLKLRILFADHTHVPYYVASNQITIEVISAAPRDDDKKADAGKAPAAKAPAAAAKK